MPELAILAVAGLGAFLLRGTFLVFLPGLRLPAATDAALRHAPVAALAALLATAMAGAPGGDGLTDRLLRGAALLVAAAVAWRTGRLLPTMAAGLTVLLVASAVV